MVWDAGHARSTGGIFPYCPHFQNRARQLSRSPTFYSILSKNRGVSRQSSPLVLIAEDEGLIALEMMEFLARKGYRVTDPVSTGEEAVERCGGDPRPDIVIMDLILAGKIDGIEAIRRIRERYPIPVILMTACSGDRTSAIVKDISPDGFLIKPFTRDELLSTIARVLESRAKK